MCNFFENIIKIVFLCLVVIYTSLLICDGMNFLCFQTNVSHYIYFYIQFYDLYWFGDLSKKGL